MCALTIRAASCGSVDSKLTSIKPAVGNSLDAEAAEKGAEFGRALLVGETAGGIASEGPFGEEYSGAQPRPLLRMVCKRQRFAGQNLRLRLDVVLEIHHVVVGIRALEGQNVGIFAVDFDAGGGDDRRLACGT